MSSFSSSSDSASLASSNPHVPYPRSNIEILLNNHYTSKVYTTGSPISGEAVFTTKRDVRFDHIQIALVGQTKTRVDGMNSPHEVTHTFLKMTMPVQDSSYPVPRMLESGRPHRVPFNFVVPPFLTINACSHHTKSEQVRDHHIQLPPTMGSWQKDDLAPQMAKVVYSIKARVIREPVVGGALVKIMEGSQAINVLPSKAEDAPLNLTKNDRLYRMTKSKTLKRNFLTGKLGRLTAEAVQPSAVFMSPDGRGITSSTARINLKFEPTSSDVPAPTVTAISGKVTAHTFFASGTIPALPNLGDWNTQFSIEKRGSYSTSVPLAPISVDEIEWLSQIARRDSGYGSEQAEPDSDSDVSTSERRESRAPRHRQLKTRSGSPLFHTSTLQVPLTLPAEKKTFIPTFHSCIASRVYTVQISISFSTGTSSSTVSVTVPLQVAVEPANLRRQSGDGLPTFEAAVEEAEADEYLRPRVLQIPQEQYQQTSSLPGYGDLARR